MSNNETKWIKLNEINNIKKTIYQNEKNKNTSKNKNKDNNISLVTQRVKINISKKKSHLNTSNTKKPKYLENKLGDYSPREINCSLKQENKNNFDENRNTVLSEQRKQISKKLRHNKSCEDGIFQLNNMNEKNLLYNSMININNNENNNSEYTITDYQNTRKTKENSFLSNKKNLMNKNNISSKKYKILATSLKEKKNIKSVKYESNIKENSTKNLFDKFEENFLLKEEKIIDKNYEKNIEQDDMIISPKIKEDSTLENKITDTSFNSVNSFNFENKFYDFYDDEDYFYNNTFENLKKDFFIFYTDDYFLNINYNMIKLEFQLFLEKIFDIQSLYHLKLNYIRNQNHAKKKFLKNFFEKIVILSKKKLKLISKNEILKINNNYNNFIDSYKSKNDSELILNNKTECYLWKNIFNGIEKKYCLTKEIFQKNVLEKYNNIKEYLNEKERKLCEKFINENNNNKNIINRKNEIKKKTIKKNNKPNQQLKSLNETAKKNLIHLKSYNNLNRNSTSSLNNTKTFNSTIKHCLNNNNEKK